MAMPSKSHNKRSQPTLYTRRLFRDQKIDKTKIRRCPRQQRPNFQTVQTVLQFARSLGKYINSSLGGISQQSIAFKFVTVCVFCTHLFITPTTVSIKLKVNAVVFFKGINAEMQRVEYPKYHLANLMSQHNVCDMLV